MDERPDPADHPAAPAPKARRIWRFLLTLSFVGIIAAVTVAAGGLWWFNRAFTAPGPMTEEALLVIPRGASVRAIGALLQEQGVVDDATIFTFGVRAFGGERPLIAGEYAFPAQVSARGAMGVLQDGKVVVRNLTIPEGLTTLRVLELIAAADALEGALPPADEIGEGVLLPETYQYARGESRAALMARMKTAMEDAVNSLWSTRGKDSAPLKSPQDAIILASIVERETGKPEERARVAAVFLNRLRRGMLLQSDPTVVYGLSNGAGVIGRPLRRSDLASDHPYNTYVHGGLPPGPIANPGRDSLAAVLQPAQTKDLYFVADGTGGHAFARTLQEHNRNVAKWRRIERQRRNANK